MKILMTGATGWIGKSLGMELVRRGHQLVCLVRDVTLAKINCPFPAQFIQWKSVDVPFDETSLEGIEGILNLLGESIASKRWNKKIKEEILNSRIQSTEHLAHFAKKNKVKCFVNASAIGFYGDRNNEELTEKSHVGSGFLASVCQQWEEKLFSISNDCRCVALRIGVVLGVDGGALEKLIPTFQFGVGGPIGDGKQWMSWIHFSDLQNLIIESLENENVTGPINATSPQPVTQKEFSQALGQNLNRPSFFKTPKFMLNLVLGEMSEFILSSSRVLPEKALQLGFQFKYPEINCALNDIVKKNFTEKHLIVHQYVEKPLEEIFSFYSNEYNLEVITPPFLGFKVLGKNTPTIQENSLINYKLSLHGIPVKWQSKILNWNPPLKFVDTQTKGPYKLWHHTHYFEKMGTGTLISDHVIYKLPFGILGYLLAGWKVNADVRNIFSYRKQVTFKYFNSFLK